MHMEGWCGCCGGWAGTGGSFGGCDWRIWRTRLAALGWPSHTVLHCVVSMKSATDRHVKSGVRLTLPQDEGRTMSSLVGLATATFR